MTNRVLDIIDRFTKNEPVNVVGVARELGLRVKRDAELSQGISGYLMRQDDGRYVVASSGHEHPYRQRFTLAHEIGHFVLHKSLVDRIGGVDDDTKYRSTDRGDLYNTYIEKLHEQQANSFAANLLMPEDRVIAFVEQNKDDQGKVPLTQLYRAFEVSPSAMRWRVDNLGLWPFVRDDTTTHPKRAAT